MKATRISLSLTPVMLMGALAATTIVPARADDTITMVTITGTGTWSDVRVVSRVETVLPPGCVSSVERESESTFEGAMQGGGTRQSLGVINRCTVPAETNARARFKLDDVTIGDKVGGLELEGWVVAHGDIRPPPVGEGEVISQYRLEIVDGSGDFRKCSGFMVAAGTSTLTGSSNTYYAQVVFPK